MTLHRLNHFFNFLLHGHRFLRGGEHHFPRHRIDHHIVTEILFLIDHGDHPDITLMKLPFVIGKDHQLIRLKIGRIPQFLLRQLHSLRTVHLPLRQLDLARIHIAPRSQFLDPDDLMLGRVDDDLNDIRRLG